MPLATAEGQARQEGSSTGSSIFYRADKDDPRTTHGKEDHQTMSAPATSNGSSESNLRGWRIAVFSFIGLLYLLSLFVPTLREALAKVFAYFPR